MRDPRAKSRNEAADMSVVSGHGGNKNSDAARRGYPGLERRPGEAV